MNRRAGLVAGLSAAVILVGVTTGTPARGAGHATDDAGSTGLAAGHAAYSFHVVSVHTEHGTKTAAFVDAIEGDGTIVGSYARPRDGSRAFIQPPTGGPTFLRHRGRETLAEAASSDGAVVYAAYRNRGAEVPRFYLRRSDGLESQVQVVINGFHPDRRGMDFDSINDRGVMIGDTFKRHENFLSSFIERHGRYHWFHLPLKRAARTYASAVNNSGVIVGSFSDHHGVSHGFIDHHGRVTVIDLPHAGTRPYRGSNIVDIANDGSWVGASTRDDTEATQASYVHIRHHGLTPIAEQADGSQTFITCINDAHEIGGVNEPLPGTADPSRSAFVGVPRN